MYILKKGTKSCNDIMKHIKFNSSLKDLRGMSPIRRIQKGDLLLKINTENKDNTEESVGSQTDGID